ncbi:Hypothetical protein MBVG_5580 [Mycoplasmopsis bovigenitalium 51080]|uniref:Uncharacterized protein n=1 Tax=Mycoplasmopsis bovigenitalium 51080 TaxID=1188235 RepID=N9TSH2_9BACT|nr:hypothetical protein [Mycoplasmopsis bovigenitalium]ENY69040.1 Hypothetical protein MBVG_5580 [Mycoplasmopsis bovigenitalium 51080]
MNKNGINIEINSITNTPLVFKNAILYFNIEESDNWKMISSKSLASYEKTVLKIQDIESNKTYYILLKNTNMNCDGQKATFNTFSKIKLFVKAKKSKIKNKYKAKLKEISQEISHLNALQNIGLKLSDIAHLNQLKNQEYELKIIHNLSLVEYEGDMNE